MSSKLDLNALLADVVDSVADQLGSKYAKSAHLTKDGLQARLEDELIDFIDAHDISKGVSNEEASELKHSLLKTANWYVNQPLITKATNDFYRNHHNLDYDELRDNATYALIKAYDYYNPKKSKTKFVTYAYVVMLNQLKLVSKKNDKVHNVPTFQEEVRAKMSGTIIDLHVLSYTKKIKGVDQMYSITISDSATQETIDYVYNLLVNLGDHVEVGQKLGETSNFGLKINSLDQPIGSDSEGGVVTQEDVISKSMPDEKIVDPVKESVMHEIVQKINHMISSLEPTEQKVLRLRFPVLDGHPEKEGLKQSEIGKKLGLTQPNVSHIQIVAMKELRQALEYEGISLSSLIS